MVVVVIATGGTIASVRHEDGLRRASLRADDLLARVPTLRDRDDLRTVDLATINSWALMSEQMLAVADLVRDTLREPDVDGVVVTHGTDTLEETAYLTDLWLGAVSAEGGVVFTGAMRAADEISPDGERNLDRSVRVAADPASRGRGALVCVDDLIHDARTLTKVASSGPGALRSTTGPIGSVDDSHIRYDRRPSRPPPHGATVEHRVPAFAVYPGMDGSAIEAALANGARGIAVQGTGLGNVPPGVAEALGRALQDQVPVVVTSRPPQGGTGLVYGGEGGGGSLAAMGAVSARELPLHKARSALMVALGHDTTVAGVRAWFARL